MKQPIVRTPQARKHSLTKIIKKDVGYTFLMVLVQIKDGKKRYNSYGPFGAKFLAMVAQDELIIKYKLKNQLHFPLKCKIPKKYKI